MWIVWENSLRIDPTGLLFGVDALSGYWVRLGTLPVVGFDPDEFQFEMARMMGFKIEKL